MQLNFLYRNQGYQIIWFHDSFDALPSLLPRLDRRTYLIYSFSWFAQPRRLTQIFAAMASTIGTGLTDHVDPSRIMFLMNSSTEFRTAESYRTSHMISYVNNACFLAHSSHMAIIPGVRKRFRAVCNSKPLAFKRHWLTSGVADKVFITYDVSEPEHGMTKKVVLQEFEPREIISNVGSDQVALVLNSAQVGLLLSAEEGACYASLEYLLCGLPVVSTPSLGGRDEYYTAENSLVVSPQPDFIAAAVEQLIRDLEGGRLAPDTIRKHAVARMEVFRATFIEDLTRLLAAEPDRDGAVQRIASLLPLHSKMLNYRNFFIGPQRLGATGTPPQSGST